MDATDVHAAALGCAAVLGGAVDRDWSVPAGELELSVAEVVAHVGDTLLWYAADLAAGPAELSTMDLRVRKGTPPAALLATVRTHAAVLAAVVAVTPPAVRGWHPAGLADASGFAAMGCDEILVHTADAAAGLEVPFAPDPALAARGGGQALPVGSRPPRPLGRPALVQRPRPAGRASAARGVAMALRPGGRVGRPGPRYVGRSSSGRGRGDRRRRARGAAWDDGGTYT